MKERTPFEEDVNTVFRANTALSQIKKWTAEKIVGPEQGAILKEKTSGDLRSSLKSVGMNVTLQILFGGGIAIFIIACFLVMDWIDADDLMLIFFYYLIGLACIGGYAALDRLKKFSLLGKGLCVAGLIFLAVGLGLSDDRWSGDIWEIMVGVLGLAGIAYSYYRNSVAVLITSHIMFLVGLGLTLETFGVSDEAKAVAIFVLYSLLILASIIYVEFSNVRKTLPGSIPDRSLQASLGIPMFMIFIIAFLFELPEVFDPTYQHSALLLVISACLLAWGLQRNQHMVAITAVVFIIFDAFYFGMEQGEIEVAGTTIFIAAAIMLGLGIATVFHNRKYPGKRTEWLGIYLHLDTRNERVRYYLRSWKDLLEESTYEELEETYPETDNTWPGMNMAFARTALLLGGSGVTLTGFILLLVFLEFSTLGFAVIFTITSGICFLLFSGLEYFRKLRPLAVGLFGVGEILLFVAFIQFYVEYGKGSSAVDLLSVLFILLPLAALVVAFWRRSYFITVVSFPLMLFTLPFSLNGLQDMELNTFGIIFLFIFVPLLLAHLVLLWYSRTHPENPTSKVVESYRYFGHILHPFFILYIVILFFCLEEMVEKVWDKSIMMLLFSAPLVAWGLKRRLYPLAISAMLVLIFDAWFFGIGIAEVGGAIIALLITSLILVGVGVYIAMRVKKGRKGEKAVERAGERDLQRVGDPEDMPRLEQNG